MDEFSTRLATCFCTTFPTLTLDRVPSASIDTVAEWDSMAQINLLTVIGEEFNLDIDFEQFDGATSFPLLLERLRSIAG
jgi:acyl carrier protein